MLSGGARVTRFAGAISEHAVSPRVGASIRGAVLEMDSARFLRPLLSSPTSFDSLGYVVGFRTGPGLLDFFLFGESEMKRNQFGLTIPWRGWALDADHFHTHTRNLFDHSALGNSNIFLPLTIEEVAWMDGS